MWHDDCKDTICSQSPNRWSMAQRAQNNEFVESGFETEFSMSLVDNDHSRLVVTGKHKSNNSEQEKFSLVKSEEGLFLYISLRLIQNYSSWVYNDFSLDFLDDLPCNGVFSLLYSHSFFHLSPSHVDQIAGPNTCPISIFLKSLGVAVGLKVIIQVSPLH